MQFWIPKRASFVQEDFLLAQHLSSIIWCEINSTTRYEHTPSQRILSQDSLRRDRLDQHGPANWLNHQDRQASQPAGPAWTSQNRRRAGRSRPATGRTGRGWPASPASRPDHICYTLWPVKRTIFPDAQRRIFNLRKSLENVFSSKISQNHTTRTAIKIWIDPWY